MAIAYDAQSSGASTPGSTITFAHTTSGSNRILFVNAVSTNGDIITGVTYGGNAMTLIDKQVLGAQWTYLYYIIAPTVGANNVVVTANTGAQWIYGYAVSYTGASQSGVPDSTAKLSNSLSPLTVTTTTIADNSWIVGAYAGNRSTTAGTNTTLRFGGGSYEMCDTNAAQTPAGSYSLSVNQVGAPAVNGMVIASFAPDVTPPADLLPSVSDTSTLTESVRFDYPSQMKLDGSTDTGRGMRWGLKIIG